MDQGEVTKIDTIEVLAYAAKNMEEPLSEKIECLLDALYAVQQIYAQSNEKVTQLEHLTQDYLHALELEATSYHERARIATVLKQCREARRPYKDNVYLTEPITAYLKSQEGKKFLGKLEHLRNLARNTERSAPGRKYTPRVLTKAEYKSAALKTGKTVAILPKDRERVAETTTDDLHTSNMDVRLEACVSAMGNCG